uniref:ADF-H domain-containing protein n=1 Tax=Hucho hucho TaxID=62062 RepID=A0A4W5LPA5_9TELE
IRLKLVLFKISDDGKCIIVDEDNFLKVKDLNGEEDVFRKIVNMMPTEDCRYALYDCSWESKDRHSTIKKKMKYASSKQYIKAKFQGKSLGVFQNFKPISFTASDGYVH